VNDDLLNTPKAHAVMKRLLAPRALATALHADSAFLDHARQVAQDPIVDIWACPTPGGAVSLNRPSLTSRSG
jgi:hypothetical protein